MTRSDTLTPGMLQVFETLPDLYLILSPALRILTASDAYLAATLAVRQEIIGKHIFEAFPDNPHTAEANSVNNLHASLQEVLTTRKPHQMPLQRYDVPQPLQLGGGFKEKYWYPINTPVLDDRGNVVYIIHKVSDVTSQVKNEQQIRKLTAGEQAAIQEADWQRRKLYNLFMQVPAMICVFKGPQHVFSFVNPPYQQLVGERPLLEKPIGEAMPELQGQPIFALLDKVYNTGETFYANEMLVQLDHMNSGTLGENYYNFIYQATRDLQGNIDGILVFAYEVTAQVLARKKVEQSEKQLQSLNEELAAANEELKTTNEELFGAKIALEHLNSELEDRVARRTKELKLAQAETDRQRQLLHTLFMEAPTPIVILDGPRLVFQLINPAYQQIFPGRALLGKALMEALPELEGTPIPEFFDKVYKTGETFVAHELPLMMARHQGGPLEQIYWTFTYQARYNDQAQVDGILVFAYEVTEQVKAREAIAASARQLQLITNALPVLIGYLDREEKYCFANQAYQEWFHQKPEDLLGRPVRQIVGDKAYEGVKEYIDRALSGERLSFEARMPYRENFVKYIRTSYVPDVQEGNVVGFYTMVTDITEQVEYRQKIEESEKRFRTLLESIPQITWTALATGEINFYNSRWYNYTGMDYEQTKAWGWGAVLHPEDLPVTLKTYRKALALSEAFELECRLKRGKDAQYRWHLSRTLPLQNEQGILTGWVGTATDIHEQKLNEEALHQLSLELAAANEELKSSNEELSQSNKQLSYMNADMDNFIYTASHDLKAPIVNIEGLMKALIRQLPGESLHNEKINITITYIQEAIGRFKRTIANLTEVVKLQKENSQPATWLDLDGLLKEVQLDLAPDIKQAGAQVEVDVSGCPQMQFSEKNLRSILYNLLSNAIKYRSPNRNPVVQIYCQQREEYLLITVQDNGLGIDLSNKQKLFSMFGRLHDHVEGSGLGLYMVKKIVDNAGGKIEVDSKVGKGSTFRVYLLYPSSPFNN